MNGVETRKAFVKPCQVSGEEEEKPLVLGFMAREDEQNCVVLSFGKVGSKI